MKLLGGSSKITADIRPSINALKTATTAISPFPDNTIFLLSLNELLSAFNPCNVSQILRAVIDVPQIARDLRIYHSNVFDQEVTSVPRIFKHTFIQSVSRFSINVKSSFTVFGLLKFTAILC